MALRRKGVIFVSRWEGWRPCPYLDPVGIPTQGFGETQGVHLGDKCWSLKKGLRKLRRRLNRDYLHFVPRRRRLKQREKAALASFAYNNGPGAVNDPSFSTLARRLKSKEGRTYRRRKRIYREELPRWVFAGGRKFEGLVKRRRAEVALACRGDYSGRP